MSNPRITAGKNAAGHMNAHLQQKRNLHGNFFQKFFDTTIHLNIKVIIILLDYFATTPGNRCLSPYKTSGSTAPVGTKAGQKLSEMRWIGGTVVTSGPRAQAQAELLRARYEGRVSLF